MTGQNTGKTVAIILGGIAGVAFLVICLLFARNLVKKREGRCYTLVILYAMEIHFITQFILCIHAYSTFCNVIFFAQIIEFRRWFTVEARFLLRWIVS